MQAFNFTIKNQSKNAVDIYIDGYIVDADTQNWLSYWGDTLSESYKSFRDKINETDASIFNVYINSGGGNVTEAMAMHDLIIDLQAKGKTVNTYGRGIVASAATYILMASKTSSMSNNSWLMIHNVSGSAYGEVSELENQIATMRKFNNQIRDFYVNATGLKTEVIADMMTAETWLTAAEAKEKGFTKNVTESVVFENKIPTDKWKFKNTEVLQAYNQSCVAGQQAAANQQSFFNQLENSIMKIFKNAFGKNFKTLETPENKAILDAVKKCFEEADEQLEAVIENKLKVLNSDEDPEETVEEEEATDETVEEEEATDETVEEEEATDETPEQPKKKADKKATKRAEEVTEENPEEEEEETAGEVVDNKALQAILNEVKNLKKENAALKRDITNIKGGQASSSSNEEEQEEFGTFS